MIQRFRFGATTAALLALLQGACATNQEPRSSEDAMAQGRAERAPSGIACYDSFGQQISEEQVAASRRYGQPYCGEYDAVQGQRRRTASPAPGRGPVMEPGSINLPASPVPLPGGMGVLR